MRKRRAQGQQAAASGAFLWVVFYAFRSLFQRGLDKSYCPPRQSFARGSLWWPIQLLNCVACRYLCRCRSASFLRRPRAAQSGLYLARLYFGVNTAPHSTQRFTSSRLLLISAHRAASSSELAMAKSVRKNAQPQIENLCSKGAWGRGPQQARGAIWIATSIACQSLPSLSCNITKSDFMCVLLYLLTLSSTIARRTRVYAGPCEFRQRTARTNTRRPAIREVQETPSCQGAIHSSE